MQVERAAPENENKSEQLNVEAKSLIVLAPSSVVASNVTAILAPSVENEAKRGIGGDGFELVLTIVKLKLASL